MHATLRDVWVVLIEDLRRTVRRRSYAIVMASVPVILLALLLAIPAIRSITDDDEERKPLGIVNQSRTLELEVGDIPGIVEYADSETGMERLTEEEIGELFVVSEDYLASGRIEWVHRGGGRRPRRAASELITAVLRIGVAADRLPSEVLARALAPAQFERIRLDSEGIPIVADEKALIGRIIVAAAATLLLLIALMIGAGSLLQSVAVEKESRMIEMLLTSVKPLSLLTAKVVASGAAWLAVVIVWGGSLVVVLPEILEGFEDAPVFKTGPVVLVWVASYFLAGFFFSAVVLVGIGAVANRVREERQSRRGRALLLSAVAPADHRRHRKNPLAEQSPTPPDPLS